MRPVSDGLRFRTARGGIDRDVGEGLVDHHETSWSPQTFDRGGGVQHRGRVGGVAHHHQVGVIGHGVRVEFVVGESGFGCRIVVGVAGLFVQRDIVYPPDQVS